jgi:hypothetical protein
MPLIIKIIIYLPATFLHELAHYITALFLGKPGEFTILPRIQGDTVVLGKVTANVKYKVLSVFISAAPLIWWVVFGLILKKLEMFKISQRAPFVHVNVSSNTFKWFSVHGIFYLWLFIQLLLAGRLSVQDIKTLAGGVFSISGIVTISFFICAYQLVRSGKFI